MRKKIDIRTWLKKNKLTMQKFADRCGVSRQFFSDTINGKVEPSFSKAIEMYRATSYDVSIFEFKPSLKKMKVDFREVAKEKVCENIK